MTCDLNPLVEGLRDSEAVSGTAGAVALLAAVTAIGNDTVLRFGGDTLDEEPIDGRDYSAMASIVETALGKHYVNAGQAHRRGFLLALADLLCTMGDGLLLVEDWQPARTVAQAFELAQARAR